MSISYKTMIFSVSVLLIGLSVGGCGGKPARTFDFNEPAPKINIDTTIGSLVEVFAFDTIQVEGYALVGGLNGTGSPDCPPQIRAYLEKYILRQSPTLNVEKILNSHDTAVVLVRGAIPAAAAKNQHFDVEVTALAGAQTTSLQDGTLWGAELKQTGKFGVATKVLATAEGAVFTDTIGDSQTDKRTGYVLAGGKVLDEYDINVVLRRPDYKIAGLIRDRLNERFGDGTAKAVSPSQIKLKVPAKYAEQKPRFISIVKATYLIDTKDIIEQRINRSVASLAASPDKDNSEIAIEALGNQSVGKLGVLLNSSNEQVRLRAARCMLNLGNDLGLTTLQQIVRNKDSSYRIEALNAIAAAAARNDAAAVARSLLRDEDFDVRLAAYEQLRKLDDVSIVHELISRSFYLEQISQTNRKAIFASRSGSPRIALFGSPIYCRKDIFAQSADGSITINAQAGQEYVSLIRKHPKRPNVIIQLKSSFELGEIIRKLCEEPTKETGNETVGLGVSYSDMIALLKQMCDNGAVEAQFRAGPLPKIGPIIKK